MKISARTVAIAVAALFGALTFWLWPKPALSDEDQIRAMIARCVRAAEEKDLGPITEAMADDFKGPGGAGRDEVRQIIAFQVLRSRETVAVFNPKLTVTLTGPDTADTSGKFVFARVKAKNADELTPDGVVSSYEIEGKLKKIDRKWRFVSATYAQGF